jgi:predicted GNAT family acetyltransferase
MAEHTITLEQNGERGRYVIALEGGQEAEMTFRRLGDVMRIAHTGVPPEFEGHGLARQLLDRAIADARAQGFKILPACSYVIAQFRRHEKEWADVIAG